MNFKSITLERKVHFESFWRGFAKVSICSMSRKGDCWDIAVVESFFHSLKTEWIADIIYRTRDDARSDVIRYIEMFYNSHRLHSFLGYKTPNIFESNFT